MRDIVAAADILKTFDSSVCRYFRLYKLINVNEEITATFNQDSVIGLLTCAAAQTNGRVILFGRLEGQT